MTGFFILQISIFTLKGWSFGVKVSHGVAFVVLGKRAFKRRGRRRWRRRSRRRRRWKRRWRWRWRWWVKKRLPKRFEGITEV